MDIKELDTKEFSIEFTKFLTKRYPSTKYISTKCSDAFFIKNNEIVLSKYDINFDKVIYERKIPDYYKDKLETYFREKEKPRKDPKGSASDYIKRLQDLIDYLNSPDYLEGKQAKLIDELGRNKNTLEQNMKNQQGENSPSETNKTTLPEELIDNIIIVKIGLRVLAKILIPYVSKNLDELNKQKLDISKCLQLLLDNWDKIYRKDIKSKYPEPDQVYQRIHALRVDRNINAHDGLEDISYRVAKCSLDNIEFLCDALGENEALKTIRVIIGSLKNKS